MCSKRKKRGGGPGINQYSVNLPGAVPLLAPLVVSPEARLRRNACCALAQIAKHSMDLAEVVVEADLFPRVLTSLKFPDDAVRKCGATVVREVRTICRFRVHRRCFHGTRHCHHVRCHAFM